MEEDFEVEIKFYYNYKNTDCCIKWVKCAPLMELTYMQDLGSCVERRKGSSPLWCTTYTI